MNNMSIALFKDVMVRWMDTFFLLEGSGPLGPFFHRVLKGPKRRTHVWQGM